MTLFKILIIFNNHTYSTIIHSFQSYIHSFQSYIHSFFTIRRGLPSWILLHFVLSYFLSRGMVQNGIPRVSCYCCSTDPSSEFISLPQKGSDRNFESLLLFLFHRTKFRVVFLFRGRVRNGLPTVSVPRNSRNSVGNNQFFRQFRLPRNYFFVGNSQP